MTTKPDLRVRRECDTPFTHGHDYTAEPCQGSYWEPASVADVLAWLIAEEGETRWLCQVEFAAGRCHEGGYLTRLAELHDHSGCGTHLVFPIPAEKETTG